MLPGVYQATKKDGTVYYRAGITYKRKHISLGSFPTEQEASEAYCVAAGILNGEITLDELLAAFEKKDVETEACGWFPVAFDKCISLINFRDNHRYSGSPIYMRKNYFSYFLSPHEELKFDIEDLFYYATHKIMRRQGHLYVNEYGMQTTILNRYGIKDYAVYKRDYDFANDDPTDFRYANIIVINRYHGVTEFDHRGEKRYRVKIHIKGNYTVGTYSTAEKAAIAYNKAVDLAKKAGYNRNFPQNFIETISASEYADLYRGIKISPKYLAFLERNAPKSLLERRQE
jgi:hypothetical protein